MHAYRICCATLQELRVVRVTLYFVDLRKNLPRPTCEEEQESEEEEAIFANI